MEAIWRLPVDAIHEISASAGALSFVGGAGDFDSAGSIRNPGDLARQIEGAVENIAQALAAESCRLSDVVRLRVLYTSDDDDWDIIAALARHFPVDPMPVICPIPEPLQPFDGQVVQIQAIAQRGWRDGTDVRVAELPVPDARRAAFGGRAVSAGLRAGEFIALASRTAPDPEDGVAQTHEIMEAHSKTLGELGAGMQDCIKMESTFFGTTRAEWAPLSAARASHFAEPGPPATVIPCQRLNPPGALTRIELMAMRQRRLTYDKYIPRDDSWPDRVWDWPINLPYRQAIRLRDMIWLGGQVPSEPFANTGDRMMAGNLEGQTRLTMSYIADLMRGFGRSPADLKLMVCYYQCDEGERTTQRMSEILAACTGGALPPVTLVAKPMMHTIENTVEIWGVGQA
jgi:enamine deaminase RidA (YjgF/YER057c/UK114 family)